MWKSRKRMLKDIRRWQDQGWISDDGAAAITRDLHASANPFGTAGALAILGAVLIGFAAMSFVAANWQDMPRLVRLGLLFAGLLASYGAAGALATRNMEKFANAATLIGVGIFGASIMLIAQMFHIEGNPPDAVLMWGAGALLAGAALTSTAALGATMPLTLLWAGWQQSLQSGVFWWFLPVWLIITGVYIWHRWRPGLNLSAIALMLFTICLGYLPWIGQSHVTVALLGLGVTGGAFLARQFLGDELEDELIVVACFGFATTFAGLFALQIFEKVSVQGLIVYAVITLTLLLAVIYWGVKNENKTVTWLGYAGFSVEVIGLYFKTFGTLLQSSLFFLVAGLIVMALAGLAYKLHTRPDLLEVK